MILLKFVLASAVLWGLYHAFIKKHASYNQSRGYLIGLCFISLLISVTRIPIGTPEPKILWEESANTIGQTTTPLVVKSISTPVSHTPNLLDATKQVANINYPTPKLREIVFVVYLLVFLLLCSRLIYQYFWIRRIERNTNKIQENGIGIVRHKNIRSPFSFGRSIFLPERLSEERYQIVVQHEAWHIHHKHFVDVFIQEILTCLFWFNPIQWIIHKDLRSIHEYQADRSTLNNQTDLYQYQTIILEEVMGSHIRLANGFNQSFTKKRFLQMKKQEPKPMSGKQKGMLAILLSCIFAVFCFVPGQSQEITIEKIGNLQLGNTVSNEQVSLLLDSLVKSADSLLPVLKKLGDAESIEAGEDLEEFFDKMDLKVNNKTIPKEEILKEMQGALKPEDFKQMERYMHQIKIDLNNGTAQPQMDSLNANALELVKNFAGLNLVQKMAPIILEKMFATMTETVLPNSITQTSKRVQTSKKEEPRFVNPYAKLTKNQVEWSNEPFGEISVASIERTSEETIVKLNIPVYANQWIRFSNGFQLIDQKKGDRYMIRRVENLPFNTEIFFQDVNQQMLIATLIFPPIKRRTKIIDIVEVLNPKKEAIEGNIGWSFRNIEVSDYKPGATRKNAKSVEVYY